MQQWLRSKGHGRQWKEWETQYGLWERVYEGWQRPFLDAAFCVPTWRTPDMKSSMGDGKKEAEVVFVWHIPSFLSSGFLYHIVKNRSYLLVVISSGAEIWTIGCFLPDYSSRLLTIQLWVCFCASFSGTGRVCLLPELVASGFNSCLTLS